MRFGWTVIAVALLAPQAAWASTSAEKLTRAKASYEDGDYGKASKALEDMFRSADLTGDELRQAHIYLAASYYYLDQKEKARLEFDALFRQSPLARVDPVYFPPEIVEMANQEATKLQYDLDHAPPPPKATIAAPPPDSPPPSKGVVVTAVPQARLENRTSVPSANDGSAIPEPRPAPPSIGYSFIPFGVGQFANEQYGKGALFLTAEVIALASFTTASALAESLKASGVPYIQYKLRNQADLPAFDTYQTIYLVSFYTGVGIYIFGVIDSLISRPSQADMDARHSVAQLDLGSGRTLMFAPTGGVLRF